MLSKPVVHIYAPLFYFEKITPGLTLAWNCPGANKGMGGGAAPLIWLSPKGLADCSILNFNILLINYLFHFYFLY
jgi:hypothetical protein